MKRAVTGFMVFVALAMTALTNVNAALFRIGDLKNVRAGDHATIEITADESKAAQVELTIVSRTSSQKYTVSLVNGHGSQDHLFLEPGSYILRVVDSAKSSDNKFAVTKGLHVQVRQGGLK